MGEFNEGAKPKSGILGRALTGNVFVKHNLAFMNEGDKDGYNVYKQDIRNGLAARTDDPASSFSNTAKKKNYKRSLSVWETKESFNPAEWEQFWLEYQPAGEFQWQGLPAEVQAQFEELFLGGTEEANEDALTNGFSEGGTTITGLVPQLLSSALTSLDGNVATPTQITENSSISFRAHSGGTGDNLGVALTTDNVFEKLEILIRNQSKAMRQRQNRKFMVSHGTADIMKEAQRLKLNFKGVDVTEAGIMRYAGYEFVENPSFPDNTILLASMGGNMKTDSIQLGTSKSSDFNNLAVARLSEFNRKWAMVLTFATDIFVVRPEEICFYSDQAVA